MKLNLDQKTKKNFKLLQACSKVKIIELTEKLMQLEKKQIGLISSSDTLHTFLEGLYQDEHRHDKVSIVDPDYRQLTTVTLPKTDEFSPDEDLAKDYKEYSYLSRNISGLRRSLEEYEHLNELLSNRKVPVHEVNSFLSTSRHTKSFRKFADSARKEPALALSLKYKMLANRIAERNGIANTVFYTNTDQAFYAKDVALSLNKDFKGRAINTGAKMLAGLALSATLYGVGFSHGKDATQVTQGTTEPHTIETTVAETSDYGEGVENPSIFTNGVQNIDSYEDACQDYFEKISDIYAYNTGESIDLSRYEQENIGWNNSTTIFTVNNNGKTYRISAQSQAGSNLKYLRQALDATGLEYEETTSAISYIVDKNDSSRSIAIADGLGQPVRSGNILSGKNNAYNPLYVAGGRDILVAQGRDASTLTEAECVGAYITSDQYNIQNDELSRALGEVQNLTRFIKNSFYYRNGESDPYTVALYRNKSRSFAEDFDARINGQTIETPSSAPTPTEQDNSER